MYITNKDIADDYNKLGKDDVQLSVIRVKDELQVGNDIALKNLEKNRQQFSTFQPFMTDDERNHEVLFGNSHKCSLAVYTKPDKVSYQIYMTSTGGCDTLSHFEREFE